MHNILEPGTRVEALPPHPMAGATGTVFRRQTGDRHMTVIFDEQPTVECTMLREHVYLVSMPPVARPSTRRVPAADEAQRAVTIVADREDEDADVICCLNNMEERLTKEEFDGLLEIVLGYLEEKTSIACDEDTIQVFERQDCPDLLNMTELCEDAADGAR